MIETSPDAAIDLQRPDTRPWRARMGTLGVIWLASYFVSVLSFYIRWGALPCGADEWWGYPLATAVVTLPASFGCTIQDVFQWLPTTASQTLGTIAMIAFWPCYIPILVLALRTGRRKYFACLAAVSLLASMNWHDLSEAAKGV